MKLLMQGNEYGSLNEWLDHIIELLILKAAIEAALEELL